MKKKDIFFVLFVVFIWGFGYAVIKLGIKGVPPLFLGTIRFTLSSIPAIFFVKRPPISWKWIIILGLTINVGHFALLFTAIKLGIFAGLSAVIMQTQVLFTMSMSVIFLKEKWDWNNIVGLILGICGIASIGSCCFSREMIGPFLLTLLAAFCWALGNIVISYCSQNMENFSMFSLITWSGAIAILPFALLSLYLEGFSSWVFTITTHPLSFAFSVIYLSSLATMIGFGLWGQLLKKYSSLLITPFALLIPIVSIISCKVIFREKLLFWQNIGCLFIFFALLINIFGRKIVKIIIKNKNL